ncbi:MAG: aminopeptidase P family N-terminal domain-containing protein, partial [Oscillospiraceae bacterium]
MNEIYLNKLVSMLPKAEMDAILVCPSEELVFLTGASPKMCERFQGLFIKADGSRFYVCNLLYKGQVENAYKNDIPVYSWFDGDGMKETVPQILKEQGLEGKT